MDVKEYMERKLMFLAVQVVCSIVSATALGVIAGVLWRLHGPR